MIDDYEYRTKRCMHTVTKTYTPGGTSVTVTRPCSGENQFRALRIGGGEESDPWTCRACGKQQTPRLKVRLKL